VQLPRHEEGSSLDAHGHAVGRRFLSRRTVWHTLGIVVAIAVAWLILRAYRQPEFMLDLMNMSWC
jgi:hypothetical protein